MYKITPEVVGGLQSNLHGFDIGAMKIWDFYPCFMHIQ